jgi:GT2 family glycosyltransferase
MPADDHPAPLVSVVAPVRNGAAVLPELLSALDAQTLPQKRFEVIIGDDGSTDGCTDGVETVDGRVRVARGPARTGYAARNRAASLAAADVLAFCDADCVPDPEWLENGMATLGAADVAGGRIRCVGPVRPTIWTLMDIETFVDAERSVKAGGLLTGNLFVRRELFTSLGGFDETLLRTGDFDFARRCHEAGAKVVYAPDAVVSHPTYNDARSFIKKFWGVNRWHGWAAGRSGRKPNGLTLRAWVPIVQTYRTRRYFGRPIALSSKRLEENGVRARVWDHARALPLIYLVLPYTACTGQLWGWLAGRRHARSGSGLEPAHRTP